MHSSTLSLPPSHHLPLPSHACTSPLTYLLFSHNLPPPLHTITHLLPHTITYLTPSVHACPFLSPIPSHVPKFVGEGKTHPLHYLHHYFCPFCIFQFTFVQHVHHSCTLYLRDSPCKTCTNCDAKLFSCKGSDTKLPIPSPLSTTSPSPPNSCSPLSAFLVLSLHTNVHSQTPSLCTQTAVSGLSPCMVS